ADQLALPQHVERDGDDHRHHDEQDLQHDPGALAQHAEGQETVVDRVDHARHHAQALPACTRPAASGAVAPWPLSTHTVPRATLSLDETGSVAVPCAVVNFPVAPSASPSPSRSAGLTIARGAWFSGCACSAAARRTTASLR